MTLRIDRDHLAGTEAAGFDDVGLVELDQPNFGRHYHQSALGHLVAGGAKAITVHRGGGDLAVGEGHCGRAVPGLGEAGVVLVETAQLAIHVVKLLPGFGD